MDWKIIVLLVNLALINALGDKKVRAARGSIRYQYNHPPESYEPIPVAIVYEEKNDREAKELPAKTVTTTVTPKSEITTVISTTKEDITTVRNDSEDIKVTTWRPSSAQRKNDIRTLIPNKIYPETEIHIPVAVVYDTADVISKEKKIDREVAASKRDRKGRIKQQPQDTTVKVTETTSEPTTVFMQQLTDNRKPSDVKESTTIATEEPKLMSDKPVKDPVIQRLKPVTEKPSLGGSKSTTETPEQTSTISKDQSLKKESVIPSQQLVTEKQSSEINKPTTSRPKETRITNRGQRGQKSPLVSMKQQDIEKQSLKEKKPITTSTKENGDTTKGKRREKDPVIPILESENHVYAQNGAFQYSYEGGDGTKAFEKGELKELDDERSVGSVSGGFSYTDKDGKDFSLTYTADENGYRPVGDHLPTPPPIPPAIARALRYLATKPTDSPDDEEAATKKSTKL